MSVEEELKVLEVKINQLKLDYERYFLGTRPREPALLRAEVQKAVTYFTNTPIQNTAQRFKFASLCSRFQAFKRRWDENLRRIEEGTFAGHRFRARLHEAERAPDPQQDLFAAYVEARRRCGQDVTHLSRDKLEKVIRRERANLRERYGEAGFEFRVVVENGKARLKARRSA